MKKQSRVRFSLGKKLAALIILMGAVLSMTALVVSYETFSRSMMSYYNQLGGNLVRTLASQLDPAELDRYYETGEMDEDYYRTQAFIRDLVESNDVEYLYVVRPHGTGVTFLFDSDMETEESGGYADGGYVRGSGGRLRGESGPAAGRTGGGADHPAGRELRLDDDGHDPRAP